MSKSSLRRQVRAALVDVEALMPIPWDLDEFVRRLASARGRPITLVPWHFPVGGDAPSGLWLPTAKADYLFHDASASPARREQIIGHELGHMLLEHTPRLADAPPGLLDGLAPSLSQGLRQRFLSMARTGYATAEEATAEEFGTSLIRLGTTRRRPGGSDEQGRLADVLR